MNAGYWNKRLLKRSSPKLRLEGSGSSRGDFDVAWRKTAFTVLFSPLQIALLLLAGLYIVWNLPMICCGRWRCVRYLPLVGIAYYGVFIPSTVFAFGLA